MLIPKYIAWAVMPLSLVLIFAEMGQVWLSRHNTHKTRSVLAEAMPNGNRRPDIILVTVDTLSAGHLHTYGYSRPTSPHLDDFSSESIFFENFYANANWTRPGVASILNGAGPLTHRGDSGIPPERVTEAQNLISRVAAAGYDIRIVNSNYFSDLEYQGVETVPDRRATLYFHTYMGQLLKERLPSAFLASLIGPSSILNKFRPSDFLKKRPMTMCTSQNLYCTMRPRTDRFFSGYTSCHPTILTQHHHPTSAHLNPLPWPEHQGRAHPFSSSQT